MLITAAAAAHGAGWLGFRNWREHQRRRKNINYVSVAGNFAMPNNGLGQAAFGNAFNSTIDGGYNGIGSGASNGYIITNMVLDYGGNLVGGTHGNFLGDMLGNGSQTVFDNYYKLNTKKE